MTPLYLDHKPPADVVRRLQQIDDRLDLVVMSRRHMDYVNVNEEYWWALILRWDAQDRRHELVRRGDLGAGAEFDILAMLPPDCGVEQAYDYLVRGLRFSNREGVDAIISRVHHWNDAAVKENLKPTMELAEELIETNVGTLFREEGKTIPKVYQTVPAPSPGKRKP